MRQLGFHFLTAVHRLRDLFFDELSVALSPAVDLQAQGALRDAQLLRHVGIRCGVVAEREELVELLVAFDVVGFGEIIAQLLLRRSQHALRPGAIEDRVGIANVRRLVGVAFLGGVVVEGKLRGTGNQRSLASAPTCRCCARSRGAEIFREAGRATTGAHWPAMRQG